MKTAYPNYTDESLVVQPVYNLNRWLDTMRQIYAGIHMGRDFNDSFNSFTREWSPNEQLDFKKWIEYHESGDHRKYKTASFYIDDNIPGYYVPSVKYDGPVPQVSDRNMSSLLQKEVEDSAAKENKRFLMEEQRKRIIGRLHAAVKHLTSQEGHALAGEEFDSLLSSLYELIKQFQTVNKVSLSNALYHDLMIRESNKLSKNGFTKSASFMRRFAQATSGTALDASGPIPVASQDTGVSGGTLANPLPTLDSIVPPSTESPKEDTSVKEDAIDELLENLETGGFTDINLSDDDEEENLDEVTLDDDLTVEAQLAAAEPAMEPVNVPVASPQPVSADPIDQPLDEVGLSEEELKPEEGESKFDPEEAINVALSNVTVENVIEKLEDIQAVCRNRQISRDLMIVDMMLSKLGLLSLFPELNETGQKFFECFSYALTRLEKMTSQLNGAVNSTRVIEEYIPEPPNPTVQAIKDKILEEQEKNKVSKERRKKLEDERDAKKVEQPANVVAPAHSTPPVPVRENPATELANTPAPVVV